MFARCWVPAIASDLHHLLLTPHLPQPACKGADRVKLPAGGAHGDDSLVRTVQTLLLLC
jgi:hypothetical protein